MAAYLILSHNRGRFPPSLDSDHFSFNPDNLRAWWSAQEKYGRGCPSELGDESVTLSDEERREEELDIWESVFRYLFDYHSSYQGYLAPVFYLETHDGRDPSAGLVARFSGHQPPVKPASAFEKVDNQSIEIRSPADGSPLGTHLNGLFFDVGEIDWKSDVYVTVQGGYYEGPRSASGSTYCLVKEQGEWVVFGWTGGWVS